jgi:hypothetical protein
LLPVCVLQYGASTDLPKLDPQHVAGLLCIALNCYEERCACDLLAWLLWGAGILLNDELLADTWMHHAAAMQQLQQAVNQADVLYALLEIAIARGHSKAVALLCQMPAASEFDVVDATELLSAALNTFEALPVTQPLIKQLPAAQRLPVSYIYHRVECIFADPLAYASSIEGADQLLRLLVTLPAAQELPQREAEYVLWQCLQYGLYFHDALRPVRQLDASTVCSTMFEALDMYR